MVGITLWPSSPGPNYCKSGWARVASTVRGIFTLGGYHIWVTPLWATTTTGTGTPDLKKKRNRQIDLTTTNQTNYTEQVL